MKEMTYRNNDSAYSEQGVEALSLTSSFGASLPPEAVAALLPLLTRSQNPLAELLSVVLNAAMKLERQEHLGVQPHERNPERNGQANGFKDRTLSTRLGQIGVSVPQVRGGEGSFRPASLEAALLSEKALKVALAEMYVQGVATRRVKEIMEALCGFSVSSMGLWILARCSDSSFMISISCPHCQSTDCIKFGRNDSGSSRCRCHECGKTFALNPKSRAMTPQKEASIVASLQERISQRGIARALKVSRLTIRNIRKKTLLI